MIVRTCGRRRRSSPFLSISNFDFQKETGSRNKAQNQHECVEVRALAKGECLRSNLESLLYIPVVYVQRTSRLRLGQFRSHFQRSSHESFCGVCLHGHRNRSERLSWRPGMKIPTKGIWRTGIKSKTFFMSRERKTCQTQKCR